MLQYLPALGEQGPTSELGLIPAALGVTSGLRTSWNEVRRLMKGGNTDNLFGYSWLKEVIMRPAKNSVCIFDSGLFTVFGMAKKDKNFDFGKFFKNYAPAYRDYINFILSKIPEESKKHVFFVNLDTDFILGLEQTKKFNEMLLSETNQENIIGTYHVGDGKKYLDELIEKFDYIAITDNLAYNDSEFYIKYIQAACEYARNKKPDIKIHALGRSDTDIFKALGNLANTCDSSSYRCFGDEETLRETNLRFSEFWSSNLNFGFCGGIEKAKFEVSGKVMTEMQYSALIIECLKLYSFLTAINKYSAQVVRNNCPVRNAIDGFFGTPSSWWRCEGDSDRYLVVNKGSDGKVIESHFSTVPTENSFDMGSLVSEFVGNRESDWSRRALKPMNL